MIDEQALVNGCKNGDRTTQRRLYELFAGKMFVVAQRYTRNRPDAEDVLQEAFIKIYERIDTFRFECPLEGWIRTVVVNTALKYLRRERVWAETTDVSETENHAPSTDFPWQGVQYQQLLAMIQQLPPGCRAVFNLFAIEGYQHQEIAEMLGVTEGTSKSQYARARQLLQQKIQQDEWVKKT